MWACSGSSTIGARVPSKSSPTTRSSEARTRAAYCCSPTADANSTALTVPAPRECCRSGSAVVVVGEDDGEPVELHRVLGRLDPLDAQVVAELLRGGLEA